MRLTINYPFDPVNWTAYAMPQADELWDIGEASKHTGEKLSPYTILDPGLLTLAIGVANWGVRWRGGIVPYDPVAKDWKGCTAKHGKHWLDGTGPRMYGGLSLCHLDGASNLQAIYRDFGFPYTSNVPLPEHFNAIVDSGYRTSWGRWADALVRLPSWPSWLVRRWLDHYWVPALSSNEDTPAMMINARIRNSRSSWGKATQGLPWREQMKRYVVLKRNEGGVQAAQRTVRQCLYTARAIQVWWCQAWGSGVPDLERLELDLAVLC